MWQNLKEIAAVFEVYVLFQNLLFSLIYCLKAIVCIPVREVMKYSCISIPIQLREAKQQKIFLTAAT